MLQIQDRLVYLYQQNSNAMTTPKNIQIGSKLYWSDAPETLAGTVVRFTPKRDVVINFVSGNEIGEKNYSLRLANQFIVK